MCVCTYIYIQQSFIFWHKLLYKNTQRHLKVMMCATRLAGDIHYTVRIKIDCSCTYGRGIRITYKNKKKMNDSYVNMYDHIHE